MPKRDRSKRDAPAAIISMAQHARPNVTGHSDAFRKYRASFSTLASEKPDGASSIPICVLTIWFRLVPLEPATAPVVDERHRDQGEEAQHGGEPEGGQDREAHRPRVEEDHLDVEDDEGHRDEVVLDRE